MTTKEVGAEGERLVREELAGRGYAVIGQNMRIGNVEVDILAMHGGRIVVIEVKTRDEGHFDADFGIDRRKLMRLCRAGDTYVRMMNLPHEVQIDAALVTNHADGRVSMEYLDDISLPPMRRR